MYFARVVNGKVVQVIVASQEFISSGSVGDPSEWIETFIDGGVRKNYAGIGYSYDKDKDVFIAPRPFPSWKLENAKWSAPVKRPDDGKLHEWDEASQKWKERQ